MSFQLSVATEVGDTPQDKQKVDYLPFGVKTIKILVSGKHSGKLHLRPKRLSSLIGEKFGHEDGDELPQFSISWGGGHENYYELAEDKQFVHFLVWHVGKELGDYQLTIEAEDHETGLKSSLPVILTVPRDGDEAWGKDDVYRQHWQQVAAGLQGVSDITLRGVYTPDYISRWWPQNRVTYDFKQHTPQVRIRHERLVDGGNGRIHIYARMPDAADEKLLAKVTGSIAYPLYDMRQVVAELYRFGGQTWVLRLWFFWLDLELDAADLNRYPGLSATELQTALQGVTAKTEGGLSAKKWRELHEIPDAERLDILFNNDLQVLYAATDLHWRELWGQFTPAQAEDPLLAQITNTRLPALARSREDTWRVVKDWATILLNQILDSNEPPYKPHAEVKAELAGMGKLAAKPGALETHSPAFINMETQRRFTSTDVTDG